MKILPLEENGLLRKETVDVAIESFGGHELESLIQKMFLVLKREHDGVALAAPQIGSSYSIFIVSPDVVPPNTPLVYINPKIIKISKEKKYVDEGCLSVRWLYGKVKRHSQVTIQAQDLSGKLFTRGATGLLAHIYQHETDHLSGVLFIDKAIDLIELSDDQIQKMEQKNDRS